MNKDILNIENQTFINKNLNSDVVKLLLKNKTFFDVDVKELTEQIEAKKRCIKKLPTWFKTQKIYYPNKLNIEQTSSEQTAQYKSEIIEGNNLIDLTGGFGIDAFYFSKTFKTVTHCEINSKLSNIVKHNYKQLKTNNIKCVSTDGLDYLKNSKDTFDCIYIDPSRRHDSKGKVFFLSDCLPNVPANLGLIFNHTSTILIKTSPLLDITVGLKELKFVKQIHIIAVNNEVKELLWLLENNYTSEIKIQTVNLKQNTNTIFSFNLNDENQAKASYSLPLTYLYEPNAAILKSGAFNSVSEQLKLFKLEKNSHLYTSKSLVNFPGRRFKIEKILPYNKKSLKNESILKANISTRNFPENVQQLRKKFKIKDGGSTYLFFTTIQNHQKVVLICTKAN